MTPAPEADPADDEPDRAGLAPVGGVALDGDEVVDGEIAAEDRRISVTAASFIGPLPPPDVLGHYDHVVPGLAREIVDQWKGETEHRHSTITFMRETDRMAMDRYYDGQQMGRTYGLTLGIAVLAVMAFAIAEGYPLLGLAGIVVAIGGLIWAMRRDSGPAARRPSDLDNPDALERPENDESPDDT